MNSQATEYLNIADDERQILGELLEAERAKLLVEIRHTDHRAFRNDLRERLTSVEKLLDKCQPKSADVTGH